MTGSTASPTPAKPKAKEAGKKHSSEIKVPALNLSKQPWLKDEVTSKWREIKTDKIGDTHYDIENHGPKKGLSAAAKDTPHEYAVDFRSKTPRFGKDQWDASQWYNLDNAGIKKAMAVEAVQHPRRYANCFRSTTPRFSGPRKDLVDKYYRLEGTTMSGQVMADSFPRNYASVFKAKAQRFEYKSTTSDLHYDIDCGPNKTMASECRDDPRSYSVFKSRTPRGEGTAPHKVVDPKVPYNTDCGPNMTVATAATKSPVVYSNVRTATPRFKDETLTINGSDYDLEKTPVRSMAGKAESSTTRYLAFVSHTERFKDEEAPPGTVYDINQGKNKDVVTMARDSMVCYSAMSTHTPRPPIHGGRGQGPDTFYDVDVLTKASVAKQVEESQIKFAATFKSKAARIGEWAGTAPRDVGRDKFYNIEYGNKRSVSRCVEESPIKLSNTRTRTPRFKDDDYTSYMVPKLLDSGSKKTLVTEALTSPRSYSVMRSTTPRFNYYPFNLIYDQGKGGNDDPPQTSRSESAISQRTTTGRSHSRSEASSKQRRGSTANEGTTTGSAEERSNNGNAKKKPMVNQEVFRLKQKEWSFSPLIKQLFPEKFGICRPTTAPAAGEEGASWGEFVEEVSSPRRGSEHRNGSNSTYKGADPSTYDGMSLEELESKKVMFTDAVKAVDEYGDKLLKVPPTPPPMEKPTNQTPRVGFASVKLKSSE